MNPIRSGFAQPLTLLLALLFNLSAAQAQTTAFTYQGRLTDAGNPANGNYDLQFKLFNTLAGGAQQGATLVRNPVAASAGGFTVQLDFGANVFGGADRYVEIGVRPAGSANAYTVLAPRQQITSSPYAIQTLNAQQLGGVDASAYVTTASGGNTFVKIGTTPQTGANFNIGGNGIIGDSLGIGITPRAGIKLDVVGNALITQANGGVIQFGTPNTENGLSNLVGTGRADLRFDGTLLKLVAGLVGGPPSATSGVVINTFGQVGVGTTNFPYQAKMFIQGGIFDGVDVTSNSGVALNASSNSGTALIANNGNFPLAYSARLLGRVYIGGPLEKPAGSFKLDHPLDPANKYLYHSFVESPDMMNIYNGNVSTDENGEATITLPDYFEALNRDFRYQLTVIGQFAQAIVSSKLRQNCFTIKTDKPNVEVSWQVTGIRQDAYANAHRIQVEEVKPAKERGFYLHPEVFGQPEEKGVEWALRPEQMRRLKAAREKLPQQTPNER